MTKQHTLYIKGNAYTVPAGFTVMTCMEYVGFRLSRGCGCRGSVCGACAIIYRVGHAPTWQVGLACQTLSQDHMTFEFLPYHEGQHKLYKAQNTPCTLENIQALHPRLKACTACNTCTKSCPMGLKVLGYIHALQQGNFEKMRKFSQECILCGLCAVRCPQDVAPMQVALTARRLFSIQQYCPSPSFLTSLAQAKEKQGHKHWQKDMAEYKRLSPQDLLQLYATFQASKGKSIT